MSSLKKIFKDLGFSETTASVYQELSKQKKVTARTLAELAGIPRPSVYDHLKILQKNGLVVELEVENKKYFQIDDPKILSKLIDEKIEDLKSEQKEIRDLVAQTVKTSGGIEAKIKFFEGKEGFRQVLNDVLWYEGAEILAMWPYADINEVIGDDYLKNFTKRRNNFGIKVRSVWARGRDTYVEKIEGEQTRVAPPCMSWHMGYIVYAEKVAFIGSRYESFSFTIQSRDFAELKKTEFEAIWKISKPAKLK